MLQCRRRACYGKAVLVQATVGRQAVSVCCQLHKCGGERRRERRRREEERMTSLLSERGG